MKTSGTKLLKLFSVTIRGKINFKNGFIKTVETLILLENPKHTFCKPLISIAKRKIFDSDFASGGVQNRETKNRRLGMIVTSFQDLKLSQSLIVLKNSPKNGTKVHYLNENKKMSDKSDFLETLSPEMTSQLFPVSCFWFGGFAPHRK